MGVSAKITAYKKNKSNAFDKIQVLNFTIQTQSVNIDRRYNTFYPNGVADMYTRESTYGLTGRVLKAESENHSDGTLTYAFITGLFVYEDGAPYLAHSGGWSNGLPKVGTTAFINAYQKPANRYESVEEVEITNALLEENIVVNYKSESNRILDVEYSFGEITIDGSATKSPHGISSEYIQDFFNTYWRGVTGDVDYEYVFGVQLFLNDVPEAWLCFKRTDITYDIINQNYIIKCYDWVKNQLNEIGGEKTPLIYILGGLLTLSQYLLAIFENFDDMGTDIAVQGMSQDWNGDEYKAYKDFYLGENFQWISVGDVVSVKQFLENVQRHYCGYVYYNANKQLAFKSREALLSQIEIDDIIEEETFEETTLLKDYNKLLINFKNWLIDGGTYSGWAFVSENRGQTYYLDIDYGLSEQDVNKEEDDYLDLRYDLPDPDFDYVIFPIRTPEQFYDDYKSLLRDSKVYKCTVDSLGVKLFDEVIYNTYSYKVINIRKDYIRESSEIEMMKTI